MHPAQKHAIVTILSAIKGQLAAVEALLAADGNEAAPAPGPSTRIKAPDESFLSPKEEDELDEAMQITEEMREQSNKLLHDMLMGGAPGKAEE